MSDLMFKTVSTLLLTVVLIAGASGSQAACVVRKSNGQAVQAMDDALFTVLQNSGGCPQNVQAFKTILDRLGLESAPYMVANRGFHNPSFGSFSFFEQVTGTSSLLRNPIGVGEFFFGHFTAAENNLVIADQAPAPGKLMVELIAWDSSKKLFNFYELIVSAQGAQWFYRGDSADILADNASLYLDPPGPKFGSTLRCSACHTSGGPIMKELAPPHNDWWTVVRPLPFTPNAVSTEVTAWVQKLGDASDFSQAVKTGIALLDDSAEYQNVKQRLSLRTTLRPLFCETEINLESDLIPQDHADLSVQIPSASIVNPFLSKASLTISSSDYQGLLDLTQMKFPETPRQDADHGWLVPVKGYSDLVAIQSLIDQKIVTAEFAADVLAIDFKNPLFSAKRCGLLQLIPPEGLSKFPDQLNKSNLPEAVELHENLTDPVRTQSFHAKRARDYLLNIQQELQTIDGQLLIFDNLIQARKAVFDAEISKNPRGQILEPGFRIVFPVPH